MQKISAKMFFSNFYLDLPQVSKAANILSEIGSGSDRLGIASASAIKYNYCLKSFCHAIILTLIQINPLVLFSLLLQILDPRWY